jgi:hypothetical protein
MWVMENAPLNKTLSSPTLSICYTNRSTTAANPAGAPPRASRIPPKKKLKDRKAAIARKQRKT